MSENKFLKSMILSLVILLAMTFAVGAQEEEDAPPSRSINSLDFQTQRPATAPVKNRANQPVRSPVKNQKRRKSIAVLTNPRRSYKLVRRNSALKRKAVKKTNSKTRVAPLKEESIGVTFWRLRPPKPEEREDAPTFPVNTGDGTDFWTAERVRSTTRFKVDDRVRFTIESPRSGFLYVVNREVYTDGTTSEAMLIYPTLQTRGRGDNSVVTGSIVDVPTGQGVFKIASTRDDYAGEEIIVIVSPVKLPTIKLASKAIPVTEERLEQWLADWGGTVDIYDATDGEGIAITRTENEAANTRALVQEEPSPQTIFKTQARSNQPLLVSFQMLAKTPDK